MKEKEEKVKVPKKKEKNEELIKLQEELGQEKEKSLRIQAEMHNIMRRKEDEISNIRKYQNEDILKDLLKTVDNFERALSMKSEENEEFLKGFEMIYNNLKDILVIYGVSEIDAINQEFDPSLHEAVLTEVKEGINPNIVIEVLSKGYKYKDKVLRPAMVKVSM